MCDECKELRRQLTALENAAREYLSLQVACNRATLAQLVGYELPPEYAAYMADEREAQTVALLAEMAHGDD